MVSLRQTREQQYLSVRDLAKAAGVSPQTVMAIEHQRLTPRHTTMRLIAKALSVAPDAIDEFRAAAEHWASLGGRGE